MLIMLLLWGIYSTLRYLYSNYLMTYILYINTYLNNSSCIKFYKYIYLRLVSE